MLIQCIVLGFDVQGHDVDWLSAASADMGGAIQVWDPDHRRGGSAGGRASAGIHKEGKAINYSQGESTV